MTARARHLALLLSSLASLSCASSRDRATSPETLDDAGIDASASRQPACDDANPCSGALACCAGACVDTSHDPANCGACGVACGASRFCNGSACDDAVFAHMCDESKVTVTLDPFAVDNEAGAALGTALVATCGHGLVVQQQSQLQPGVLAMDAGRPATGVGDLLVAGGGYFGQLAVAYMDSAGLTPVYLKTDGVTARLFDRATGTELVSAQVSDLGPHHDFFFLELAVEPQSGTLCFFGGGILGPGTQAAGWYGVNQLLPGCAGDAHSWYVVEWTDTNGDGTAGPGDAFDVQATGP